MRAQSIKTERGPEIHLDSPDLLKRARYELSRKNTVLLRIGGTAMKPVIDDGDVVTVEPVNAQNVRTGDIVLYQSLRDTALIHRIVKLEQRAAGRFIVTRGDACATCDVPVPIHHIMGRISAINRDGEQIDLPQKPTGLREIALAFLKRLFSRRIA